MAFNYFIYRTDYGNTIARITPTNTSTGGTEAALYSNFVIPYNQPTYLWRKMPLGTGGGNIVPNISTNINAWTVSITPAPVASSIATMGQVTGITSVLQSEINYISGVTATKLNANIFTGYSATTGLQQVTNINATTNIESTFNGGLRLHKIRPTGNTTTAIQLNAANGSTNIINIDTISGLTGFGTVAPLDKIHIYGTDISDNAEYSVQKNGLTLDGVNGADKEITWSESGIPKWQAGTFREENGDFWYLDNIEGQTTPLTIMETGRLGINKQTNYMNQHVAQIVGITGLDDLVVSGIYTQNYNSVYEVQIHSITGGTDKFQWRVSIDNGITYGSWSAPTGCTIIPVLLEHGVYVNFLNTTGHGIGAMT